MVFFAFLDLQGNSDSKGRASFSHILEKTSNLRCKAMKTINLMMDIYYNGVGILRKFPPKEMENAIQEHLEEWERTKAKTA